MQFSFDLLAFILPALNTDVIAPPTDAEGGLFSETNDNSVAILLTYGTARAQLAGDTEAREEYMASAAPDKWVVNDYPAHYETTNLRASFE